MKSYFDTQIKPASQKLSQLLGDERVNELDNWRDEYNVLHIREINDEWAEYHLKNGKWVKQHDSKKPF